MMHCGTYSNNKDNRTMTRNNSCSSAGRRAGPRQQLPKTIYLNPKSVKNTDTTVRSQIMSFYILDCSHTFNIRAGTGYCFFYTDTGGDTANQYRFLIDTFFNTNFIKLHY